MNETNDINDMRGRAALVTGGGRGIGAAVVLKLAERGADVALTYEQDEDSAARVAEKVRGMGRRALAIRADGGDAAAAGAAVDEAAAAFGRLDVLVNNAAVFPVAPIEDLGPEEVDRTLAVNVRGPFLAARAAAGHMTEGGRIVSIGSNVAERTPFPGFALYALSKTALIGMTKGLARDLGPRGITVNLVNPGPTDTALNPADGPMADTIRGLTALGRYAAPAEIAEMVAHLAGDGGRYVTGATIDVDGGWTV
ncbi:SDR family NAD(P)-dependent oxidoreductase [Microbispora sp. H10949]|uniref:SDR family NAD(P)-dependent oxidoreductase n=1 Tax=Microbispora sp. H10949 TaxID=2729111 RepID=UPI001602EF28|nr:SDR family oxidoreductase [Microbispora sp. H10949]